MLQYFTETSELHVGHSQAWRHISYFLSHNLYDKPGLAPRMNVLLWRPVSYSNRDTSWTLEIVIKESFMVDMEILFSNMKYPSHECEMTSYSDFQTNRTFHQFHDLDIELDLHRIMSSFHGAFAKGLACQQGKLTLPLLGTCFCSNVRRLVFLKLPCLFPTFL